MDNTSRQLLLLRHAKATFEIGGRDVDRPLSEVGCRQAVRLGKQMKKLGFFPDYVVSSSAKRAVDTCYRVCSQLDIPLGSVYLNEAIYQATASLLLSLLASTDKTATSLLIVGHNPALEDLATLLSLHPSSHDNEIRMYPATLIELQFNGDWSDLQPDRCELKQCIHGKWLE